MTGRGVPLANAAAGMEAEIAVKGEPTGGGSPEMPFRHFIMQRIDFRDDGAEAGNNLPKCIKLRQVIFWERSKAWFKFRTHKYESVLCLSAQIC